MPLVMMDDENERESQRSEERGRECEKMWGEAAVHARREIEKRSKGRPQAYICNFGSSVHSRV